MSAQPNVLFITADQYHHSFSGHRGGPAITPNLDDLAAGGVCLTNHYTQNPICTPSRVCFLSGQYPHNHGYYAIGGPTPQIPSFLHQFKRAGYRTAAIGKLHLPDNPRNWLADCCDVIADTLFAPDGNGNASPYRNYLRSEGILADDDHRGLQEMTGPHHWDARPSRVPLEHCVEAWITKGAEDFLAGLDEDQPFCMHLSYPRPHHAITPDQKFWDMYPEDIELPETLMADCSHRPPNFQEMADYCRNRLEWAFEPKDFESAARRVWRGTLALATQNDYFYGKLFETLKKSGRFDNTIIISTADHGCYHGRFGIMEKAPGICSDAIGRVPSVWHGPGFDAGAVREQFVEHVDIAPTLCSLAGIEAMTTCDGMDVSGILTAADATTKDVAVTEWPWSKAIRWKNFRFVHYHRRMYDGKDVGELYDLAADPEEQTNLYHDPEYHELVSDLRRRLLEWVTETTRITTMHPYMPDQRDAVRHKRPFQIDPDHREPNTRGVEGRLRIGHADSFDVINYL